MRGNSMSVVIPPHSFDYQNVYFHKAVHNTIIANSKFIRTIYSNGLFTLNNICLEAPIVISGAKANRFFFDLKRNNSTILFLLHIENNILARCAISNKTPRRKLSEQLRNGFLKIFTLNGDCGSHYPILLKISGVWESETEFGITFKFVFGLPIGHEVVHYGFHNRNKYQIQHR